MKRVLALLIAVKFYSSIGRAALKPAKEFMEKHKFISFLTLILVSILMLMLLTSCSTVQQRLNPNVIYRRDIKLEINDQKFDGVGVPKKADKYKIKMKTVGKIDALTIRTCHREEVFSDPDNGFSGKKFEYEFIPVSGIEDKAGCKLDIGAFEEKKGRNGFATVDFETGVENLPALVKCDGREWNTNPGSVSICQARAGSLQEIVFDHKVKTSPDLGCEILRTKDEMNYQYIAPEKECTIYFGDKWGNFHRHTIIGYSGLLIRGK